jgi:hypothetical protein
LFAGVGRKFTAEELAHLKAVLDDQLAQAYAASPRSMITISFNAPSSQLLNYHIKPEWWTLGGAYELLDVRVIQRDVFATLDDLRQDYELIVLSEVASDFRTTQQLRGLFELATHCLAPGGRLVFNAFLAHEGYTPDDATRELGQQSYTSMFTRAEMAAATAGLPVTLLADDSVHDYEKAHLPDGAWPPTNWYPNWTAGQDVFDLQREYCPIYMRWLVYQKAA